jgi:nucleotide-binding universal stress UspA family protein
MDDADRSPQQRTEPAHATEELMWSMKTILVPTDFSEIAAMATETAMDLAKAFSASVVLMHAYELPVYTYAYPTVPYVPTPELAAGLEEAAARGLEALRKQYEQRGVPLGTLTRAGIAWEQILAAAATTQAGLIVMGTHGRRGLPRALMGSVAEKVVRLSPVPVLTVRAPVPGVGPSATRGPADPGAADRLVEQGQL